MRLCEVGYEMRVSQNKTFGVSCGGRGDGHATVFEICMESPRVGNRADTLNP